MRGEDATVASRPRRSSCSFCAQTHVLLPASVLARRADAGVMIGTVLLAKATGAGDRSNRGRTRRPPLTVSPTTPYCPDTKYRW